MDEIVLIIILGLLLLFVFYIGVRNQQVYNLRQKIIRSEKAWLKANPSHCDGFYPMYNALPPYFNMVLMFWIRVSTFEKRLKPIEEYHKHREGEVNVSTT